MSTHLHSDQRQAIASLTLEIPASETLIATLDSRKTIDFGLRKSDLGLVEDNVLLYDGDSFRIGRSRDNDLILASASVSRHHAMISASNTGLVISDLSSMNGTFVNGRAINTPVTLVTGDIIRVGRTNIGVTLLIGPSEEDSLSYMQTQSTQLAAVLVTVMVADVMSFTRISQMYPPAEVAGMLDRWFGDVSEIVQLRGGQVDKYIGDCVMALWISGDSKGLESAENAVLAAKEIVAHTDMISRSGSWKYCSEMPWRCRVALNTGEALMGSVGAKAARDFTVLGDTVNVAFRLESIASKFDVSTILSLETVRRLNPNLHNIIPLGEVDVEGRDGTINVFSLGLG